MNQLLPKIKQNPMAGSLNEKKQEDASSKSIITKDKVQLIKLTPLAEIYVLILGQIADQNHCPLCYKINLSSKTLKKVLNILPNQQ